jgi:hypothetical protein
MLKTSLFINTKYYAMCGSNNGHSVSIAPFGVGLKRLALTYIQMDGWMGKYATPFGICHCSVVAKFFIIIMPSKCISLKLVKWLHIT